MKLNDAGIPMENFMTIGFESRLEAFKAEIKRCGLTIDQFLFLYENYNTYRELCSWSEINNFHDALKGGMQ